jgi:hypothetical protein
MIAEHLIFIATGIGHLLYAVFVFIVLVIGLVLTVQEFRYGDLNRQQAAAKKKLASINDLKGGSGRNLSAG